MVTEINGLPQPMDSRFDTITVPSQIGDKPGSIRITGPVIVWRFVFHSQQLTLIVLRGSGGPEDKDRHWHGKVSDAGMLPNAPGIDKEEARQLVHWILSQVR